MAASEERYLTVRLSLSVLVDANDDELLDRYDETTGPFSVAKIVRSEVQSNLESLSYIRRVTVTTRKGGEL